MKSDSVKDRPILFSGPMVRALLSGAKTQTRRIIDLKRLRVRVRSTVRADLFPGETVGTGLSAGPGIYAAQMNQYGAVSIKVGGSLLGVKPGEFDFVCPYAEGRSHLADHGFGRKVWTITPEGEQRLWVRETWGLKAYGDDTDWNRESVSGKSREDLEDSWLTTYAADWGPCDEGAFWRPSIFLPRWASRITLEATGVRVERVQDISEEDARAEGVSAAWPCYPEVEHREGFRKLWGEINGAESWNANPWVWVVSFKRIEAAAGRAA